MGHGLVWWDLSSLCYSQSKLKEVAQLLGFKAPHQLLQQGGHFFLSSQVYYSPEVTHLESLPKVNGFEGENMP